MNNADRYIAIEGPVCAGKTTLCNRLIKQIYKACVVPDYSDFAGGGKNLPPPYPPTVALESKALKYFILLEEQRFTEYDNNEFNICFIDRSVHTLIGHCYSLSKISGLPYFELAVNELLESKKMYWPSTIIFLDISEHIMHIRNSGKFQKNNIFIDYAYNTYFREYFISGMRFDCLPELIIINGELSKEDVCTESINKIKL